MGEVDVTGKGEKKEDYVDEILLYYLRGDDHFMWFYHGGFFVFYVE
jgi:hypothetical protein